MSAPVLQLHGILAGSPPRQQSKHPHRVLHFGRLAGLVSRCPFDGQLDEVDGDVLTERVKMHHDLLLAYSTDHVLLPTRFGAFFSSIEAMRGGVKQEERAHLAALAHLKGRQEFSVRLTHSKQHAPTSEPPKVTNSGSEFLVQRRRARDRRQTVHHDRREFAQKLTRELEKIAAIAISSSGDAMADLAMLLTEYERTQLQEFLNVHGPLAEQLGLILEASGPWPAYSFDAHPSEQSICHGA